MGTYFASPERSTIEEFHSEVEIINRSSVMSALLYSVSGLLAVLDSNRQILSLNDSFLELLGVKNSLEVLGLRPGEALNCTYCGLEEGGCGTSRYCSSCGAAIAIVGSITRDEPVERTCSLRAELNGSVKDLVLSVKSTPIEVEGKKFLLIFMQDITLNEKRAALERTFFHDFNNMLTGLLGASDMLGLSVEKEKAVEIIRHTARRMKNEFEIQELLLYNGLSELRICTEKISPVKLVEELELFFHRHPCAAGKNIVFRNNYEGVFCTDGTLLCRVLSNMIINALEATESDGVVTFTVSMNSSEVLFRVWNDAYIPLAMQYRIFQRNCSTKSGAGRGIGTYSMKLFGEKFLGGSVSFTSTMDKGTEFLFSMPLNIT